MQKIRGNDTVLGLLLAAAVFCVYCLTLSSTVTTEDPGELAAAVYSLGIVHPTGYPLFTLLGWMFSHLPLGHTIIWRLNLFGAVLTSVATFLFFQLFLFLLSDAGLAVFKSRTAGPSKSPPETLPHRRWTASLATLVLAFTAVYWGEAVALEVYALHLVFLALVTWLFLRSLSAPQSNRRWLLFAFVLGLSFTNHMMTVLLAPAFLALFFNVHGFGRPAWTRILKAIPPFLLALTLYLYLPLRALQKPVMNWGNPSTPGDFWRHVTAAQFGQQMFSSREIALSKLAQFFTDLPANFGYVPLLLVPVGIWTLWRRQRPLALFAFLIFVTGLFYAVNYSFDDPNFNLNSHFAITVGIAFGLRALLQAASGTWRWPARVLCVAVALCPLVFNYPLLNKSRDFAVDEYARNVLNSMDSGAVFFTNEYERLGGPAFYLQQVEGFRRDVVVLDIMLLGNPWFYGHLEARYPGFVQRSRPAIEAYRETVTRFSRGEDTTGHNARLIAMFHDIIAKNRGTRPVYVSSGINPAAYEGYNAISSGMVFRLLRNDDTVVIPIRYFAYHPLPSIRANPTVELISIDYAQGYAQQGSYRVVLGDTMVGMALLRKALEIEPEFPDARNYLSLLEQLRSGRNRVISASPP